MRVESELPVDVFVTIFAMPTQNVALLQFRFEAAGCNEWFVGERRGSAQANVKYLMTEQPKREVHEDS